MVGYKLPFPRIEKCQPLVEVVSTSCDIDEVSDLQEFQSFAQNRPAEKAAAPRFVYALGIYP